MPRLFAAFCLVLVFTLAYANHRGYVYANFFNGQGQSASSSGGHSSGGHYHK